MTRIKKNTGIRQFVQTAYGRAYPRLIGQQRNRAWLFFEIALPLLLVTSYVYVYRAMHAPEEYIGFVVLGGAMLAFWWNVLWSLASQMYWEKEQGNLSLYIMAPCSMMAILCGMALGGMLTTFLRAVIIIALGALLFNVHFVIASWIATLAVFALTLMALYGLGMMASSIFLLLGREAWHIANLVQHPFYFFSGLYFPIKNLNAWVVVGASVIPLTLGIDAMRQLTFAGGASIGVLPVSTEMMILGGLAAVFLAGSRWSLRTMERLAIREGRITESRG